MQGKEEGAAQHQQITHGHREALVDAQQIKACHGDGHTQPDDAGDLFLDEHAQQRHDDDVQSGDKTGLAGSGHADTELLEGTCHKQEQTAENAADHRVAGDGLLLFGRQALFGRFDAVKEKDHRDQHQTTDQGADAVIGKGLDMIHAGALGNERCAPDQGCQQQHQIAAHFLAHRNSSVLLYFMVLLYLTPAFFTSPIGCTIGSIVLFW